MNYSIVIPAYNEADKIIVTLNQVVTFLREYSPGSFEVVVSDDGSADATVSLVEQYIKENPEVRILKNKHKGKGPTVWMGMMEALGDYIYMCDTDLSTPITELKKLTVWAQDNDYDIVIASREGATATRINEPFYRHIMGRGFNLLTRIFALRGIKDTQCGFKLFKHECAKDVFGALRIYGASAQERSEPYLGAFDVEVLYLALKKGYKIKELPVIWKYVPTTRLNAIKTSINMALDVFQVRINDLKGVYNVKN